MVLNTGGIIPGSSGWELFVFCVLNELESRLWPSFKCRNLLFFFRPKDALLPFDPRENAKKRWSMEISMVRIGKAIK